MPTPDHPAHRCAQDLLDYIAAGPTPWHAAAHSTALLDAAGFTPLAETQRWELEPGGRHYVVRGGSSVIAFRVGQGAPAQTGYRIVAAHTDSPGLRLKPAPATARAGLLALGVEVYGSPILATFADRDLGLAGRVILRTARGLDARLLRFPGALARIPNLAIHLNRKVNEEGLRLNAQTEGHALVEALGSLPPAARLTEMIAGALAVAAAEIAGFEFALFDAQPGAFFGTEHAFIASRQLDNLASCHAALTALTHSEAGQATAVVALFDHEEVGSESGRGAAGVFLPDVLGRIALVRGLDAQDAARARAASFLVSADMAHAQHPNRPEMHDPGHAPQLNAGPVIKTNAAQRYATDAMSAARFQQLCEVAEVPFQRYAQRADLGCGTTVGPPLAARLGMATVDVGNPMWAMHSARESAGARDPHALVQVLARLLAE